MYRVSKEGLEPYVGELVPKHQGPLMNAGNCGQGRRGFCEQKWPTGLLGPRPVEEGPELAYQRDVRVVVGSSVEQGEDGGRCGG